MHWSNELRVMLRPIATYRELAKEADKNGVELLFRRPLFIALAFGAFTSLTVSGRLTFHLLIDGALSWSLIPVLQLLVMTAVVFAFSRGRVPIARAIDLFFMGHGPLLFWLLGVAGACLFFPSRQIHLWPTVWGWLLPISFVVVLIWSNVTTFGFLKGALNLSRLGAGKALLLYTMIFWGLILSYLFSVQTLQLHRLAF